MEQKAELDIMSDDDRDPVVTLESIIQLIRLQLADRVLTLIPNYNNLHPAQPQHSDD